MNTSPHLLTLRYIAWEDELTIDQSSPLRDLVKSVFPESANSLSLGNEMCSSFFLACSAREEKPKDLKQTNKKHFASGSLLALLKGISFLSKGLDWTALIPN